MNAKRILISFLAMCLVLVSVSACGNHNKSPNTPEAIADQPVDTSPIEIEDEGVNFWVENNVGFDSAIEGTAADFELQIADGKVTILSYKGTHEHLMVPETIDGQPITAIADGAFANHTSLKTLMLPESIGSVGTGILVGCDALNALQTPLLGANKESKQYLGYLFGAPRHEDNARDVPASLTSLCLSGDWDALPAYALFDCNDLVCLGFPQTVTVIEKYALFNCASLRQIDGLANVVTFGDRALMNCASLQIVTLGNALETVGFGTFEGCTSLRALTLPFVGRTQTENTYLGYIFGASQPDFAEGFYPKDLARVTLTEKCQALGNYAFFECLSLKEIILPERLKSIGVRAFYGCEKLWSIQIPNSVTTIRELAFAECDALSIIDFGDGLTEIGINAFYNCDSLTEIVLPNTLKSLPASCFAGCIALAKIDLGGVREVGAQAFRHCNAVTSVTTDESVTFAEGNDSVKSLLNEK